MKDISNHIDEYGFIVSTEPDIESRGGNSAQHSAIYYIAENKNFASQWSILDKECEPRLHWKGWPSDRGHMSRDNLTCCVCKMKLDKMYPELRSLFYRIFMRAGFMWNTKRIGDNHWNVPDFCGPLMVLIFLRFKYSPLNLLADAYLLIAAHIHAYNTRKTPSHSDGHLNIIILIETSRRISDNFILRKLRAWYKSTKIPQAAVIDYFENAYSPPLHIQLNKIIEGW